MDAIRALLNRMKAEEERLLVIREQRMDLQARLNFAALAGLVILSILFAGAIFYLYRRMTRLQEMVTVCAWSRTVEHKGEWLSFEEYMLRRFGIDTTHSISPEEAEKVMAFTVTPPQ